jgi:CheY-like chemotaxis protein
MLRPLLLNQSVSLVFEDATERPALFTDEGKISQILRNLISNALKFTERGEVRVAATAPDDEGFVAFSVVDTGIGIAPEDQSRIFEEFTQVEHRLQTQVRGTGLGLPLSRRLAELLGGVLNVESTPGLGSTFTLRVPARYNALRPMADAPFTWEPDAGKLPLLVVEDAADAQYFYEKVLRSSAYQIYPAYTLHEAEVALRQMLPAAVILDIVLGPEDVWELLVRLRRDERTHKTPIVVVSSGAHSEKALALGADVYLSKPVDRRSLLDALTALQSRTVQPVRVLSIDDEEVARYLVRQYLPPPAFEILEAGEGRTGIEVAESEEPDVVLLDLVMPGIHGWQVRKALRDGERTRDIPVIILTSQALDDVDREAREHEVFAVLSKQNLARATLGPAVLAAARSRTTRDIPVAPRLPL